MKKFTYTGNSNLIFTFEKRDYLVHSEGPHELPETSAIVKLNVATGKLVEVTPKNKN